MKNMFLACEFDTVELETIKEILGKHKESAELQDVNDLLKYGGDDEVFRTIHGYVQNYNVYLLPGVPTERLEELLPSMMQLTPTGVAGGMSVLLQVAALVNHRPTRWEWLISRYAMKHIPGLYEVNATHEEIQSIVLRDHLAWDIDMAEEASAAKMVKETKPLSLPDKNIFAYIFRDPIVAGALKTTGPNPWVERAVVDALLIEHPNASLIVGFMDCNEDGYTDGARIYTNQTFWVNTAVDTLTGGDSGYILSDELDDCGMHYVELVANDLTSLTTTDYIMKFFIDGNIPW